MKAPTARDKIVPDFSALQSRRAAFQAQGLQIVFTNGCFDLLHVGHVRLLQAAAALGDALVVALNTDESVRKLKGPERPILPLADRMEVVAALGCVDWVTSFAEPDPLRILTVLQPDILVKGGDWGPEAIIGREVVEARGGRVVRIPLVEGRSTTGLIAKARKDHANQ